MLYALKDFGKSIANIRLWSFIAAKNIQIQYRRNILGLFWLVISFGIPALGIGYVLSKLQGLALIEHLPHVMFGFVGWYFVSDCLTQGSRVLTRNRPMLLQAPMGRSVFALSMVVERFILLSVNLIVAAVLSSFFGWRITVEAFFIPVSILIILITGIGTVMFLSVICARIRDLAELIASVVRLAFFFTPIIWSTTSRQFSPDSFLATAARFNPLTYFVDVLRMPMLGSIPDALTLTVSCSIAGLMMVLGLIAIQRGGRGIAFYV